MPRGNGGQSESKPAYGYSLGGGETEIAPQKSSRSYDETMSEITRQQYEDYQKRFLPYEQRLLDLASSDELLTNQLGRNVESVGQAFDTAAQTESMKNQRFGLGDTSTAQQKANTGLEKALTLASVQNETRQAVGDIKQGILTGAVTNPKKALEDIGGN